MGSTVIAIPEDVELDHPAQHKVPNEIMGSTVIAIPEDVELDHPAQHKVPNVVMGPTVIPISDHVKLDHLAQHQVPAYVNEEKKPKDSIFGNIISFLRETLHNNKYDKRKVLHSIKAGISLVLVSLLYLIRPLYAVVGQNAMWAIMTVVIVLEFYAGAVLAKGINRVLGTTFGGVMGYTAAIFAREFADTRKGRSIIIGFSIFIFGATATYARTVPCIKKSCDYGAMIFILTFSLVIVSDLNGPTTMLAVARERVLTIGIGVVIVLLISFLVFPTWASDELHHYTAHKFQHLADSIEGCLENYFRLDHKNDEQMVVKPSAFSCSCKSVLQSKAKDESLANFAKWEPWHGRFGIYWPWEKYLQVGELLRELAAIVFTLKACLQSPRQPSWSLRQSIAVPSEVVGLSLAYSLRELGESLKKMRRCKREAIILPKLKFMKLELSSLVSPSSKFGPVENVDELAVASFVFLLTEMVGKVEELAKEVEEIGKLADFPTI